VGVEKSVEARFFHFILYNLSIRLNQKWVTNLEMTYITIYISLTYSQFLLIKFLSSFFWTIKLIWLHPTYSFYLSSTTYYLLICLQNLLVSLSILISLTIEFNNILSLITLTLLRLTFDTNSKNAGFVCPITPKPFITTTNFYHAKGRPLKPPLSLYLLFNLIFY